MHIWQKSNVFAWQHNWLYIVYFVNSETPRGLLIDPHSYLYSSIVTNNPKCEFNFFDLMLLWVCVTPVLKINEKAFKFYVFSW